MPRGKAGAGCLSGCFGRRLLRHRSDSASGLGFSDEYSYTKLDLPAERAGAGAGKVFFRSPENNGRNVGTNFAQSGKKYIPPKMVLYSGSTRTACGYGQAAMGPFYCPSDHKLYVDLSFYKDMQRKLGGGGDFALGYVLAHEVGHHVQTLLGISSQVQKLQSQVGPKEANRTFRQTGTSSRLSGRRLGPRYAEARYS